MTREKEIVYLRKYITIAEMKNGQRPDCSANATGAEVTHIAMSRTVLSNYK